MIEQEKSALRDDPEREVKTLLSKLSKLDRKRSGFQDMAAEGLITFDELREQLTTLEEAREAAKRELEAVGKRRERVEQLEGDKEALLEHYSQWRMRPWTQPHPKTAAECTRYSGCVWCPIPTVR